MYIGHRPLSPPTHSYSPSLRPLLSFTHSHPTHPAPFLQKEPSYLPSFRKFLMISIISARALSPAKRTSTHTHTHVRAHKHMYTHTTNMRTKHRNEQRAAHKPYVQTTKQADRQTNTSNVNRLHTDQIQWQHSQGCTQGTREVAQNIRQHKPRTPHPPSDCLTV